MNTYFCESCGAKIITQNNASFATCMYCGNTIAFIKDNLIELNIKKIIPFTINKEEVIEKFSKIMAKKVVEAHKIYLPVRFCNIKFQYLYSFEYRYRNNNDSYSHANMTTMLDGKASKEIIFGNSHIHNIYMLDELRKQRPIPYQPELVKDVSIEYCEFDEKKSMKELEEKVQNYSRKRHSTYDITNVYSENYSISDVNLDPYITLIPVYVIQTEDHILYNISGVSMDKQYQMHLWKKSIITIMIIASIISLLLAIFTTHHILSLGCLFLFLVIIAMFSSTPSLSYFEDSYENFEGNLHKDYSAVKELK